MCSISKELMELEIKVERKIGIMGRFAEYEKEWVLRIASIRAKNI